MNEILIIVHIPLDHAEDKICIFGFSRGAYTARALAGMIHKVCTCLHHIWASITWLVTGGLAPCGQLPTSRLRI